MKSISGLTIIVQLSMVLMVFKGRLNENAGVDTVYCFRTSSVIRIFPHCYGKMTQGALMKRSMLRTVLNPEFLKFYMKDEN